MKASDYIKELQRMIEIHGDLEVKVLEDRIGKYLDCKVGKFCRDNFFFHTWDNHPDGDDWDTDESGIIHTRSCPAYYEGGVCGSDLGEFLATFSNEK